jgi:hypothetical protein
MKPPLEKGFKEARVKSKIIIALYNGEEKSKKTIYKKTTQKKNQ